MLSLKPIQQSICALQAAYPWTSTPLIVGAPMRILASAKLATAISSAGGLGFIGPGEHPADLSEELEAAREQAQQSAHLCSSSILPVGIGIQTWCGDLATTARILRTTASPPAAAWLFAPRHGQSELDIWAREIRAASPHTKIWIQVASVAEAEAAVRSPDRPDVVVVQGTDAGGHSRRRGAGIVTLVPEIYDAIIEGGGGGEDQPLSFPPLVAAGGIADGRGAAAAMVLGAAGVAMGTRFLATPEARINPGYRDAVLEGRDGGQATVRTQLYNHLRGTMDWPPEFDARGLINASWRDHLAGMSLKENRERHAEALRGGGQLAWGADQGRTATYAGTVVGLVKDIRPAGDIVREVRHSLQRILVGAADRLQMEKP